jgi:CubicO group peptidase (beta-lactamase class C family)
MCIRSWVLSGGFLPGLLLGLLSQVAELSAHAAAPVDATALDAVVENALQSWRVPGIAVAVVKEDEVVYLRGGGTRELGRKEPITPDTLFGIGSCTKAFTAAALGLLVDEKKADWDDLVRKHLAWFRLADPLADRDVTLRDLLCHRTGLGRHDLLWYRAPWSIEESVRRLAVLPPSHSFRSTYEYNNVAYLAAGLAIGSAGQTPWHDFVRRRLLVPLGMSGVVFTSGDAQKAPDHSSPHGYSASGEVVVLPWYKDDQQIRASGSIKAGVRDLSRWLRFQLNGGQLDGKRLISAASLAETHTPQVPVPLDVALARLTDATQSSYGLGWHITDYRGYPLLEHGGAVDGFRARIMLLPRHRLGLVVLANLENMEIVNATGNSLLDHLLGLPKKDWTAFFLERYKSAEATRKARLNRRLAGRIPGTRPSRELAAYTGDYTEGAYGTVKVLLEAGELVVCWSSFRVPLRHFHYDTFLLPPNRGRDLGSLAGELAQFALNAEGSVTTLDFLGRTFARDTTR